VVWLHILLGPYWCVYVCVRACVRACVRDATLGMRKKIIEFCDVLDLY